MFHTLLRALFIKRDLLAALEKEYPSTSTSFDNLSTSQKLRPKWIQVPLPLLELTSWIRLGNEWEEELDERPLERESKKERSMICKWKSNMFVNQPNYIKHSGLNNRRGNLVFVTSLLIKEEGREWVQEREERKRKRNTKWVGGRLVELKSSLKACFKQNELFPLLNWWANKRIQISW